MTPFLKAVAFAFLLSLTLFLTRETGLGARADSKLVVRIETATATLKGGRIVIHVVGMGRTSAMIRGGGELLRHGQSTEPNKDGLLEYDLYYVPPRDYSGDKLKPVKASLVVSNVPPGVKGVRLYAEFNEINAMLPESKVKERRAKKNQSAIIEEEPVATKKEPAAAEERPKPKKEGAAAQAEVQPKKSRGWNLNPFHRKPKPTPTPQPTPAVSRIKKPQPTPAPKKEEMARVMKTPTPEKPKKKKGLFGWSPFHHEATPAPQTETAAPEPKKPESTHRKPEASQTPVPKIEELGPTETPAPKARKKRGWNLNPFHRQPKATPTPTPQPTPAVSRIKKPEPTSTPKKEETPPKKEEKKKKPKKKWENLNPLHWNPFKHPTPEPTPE